MRYRVPVEFEAESHAEARRVVATVDVELAANVSGVRVLADELTVESRYFYHVPAAADADASEVA